MMDKYTKLQMTGIYAAVTVFLIFILLPFFEMFMASLRPLEHLPRSAAVEHDPARLEADFARCVPRPERVHRAQNFSCPA